jgi:hypothetical protein
VPISASDNCSGSVPVSSNAPAVFPPGTTTVIFSAADVVGNSATASTTVTVMDTIAPSIQILSPQARNYAHADPVVVSFSVIAAGSGLLLLSAPTRPSKWKRSKTYGAAVVAFGLSPLFSSPTWKCR